VGPTEPCHPLACPSFTDQTAPVGGTLEIPQQSRTNSPTCAQRRAGE
jgi:hypothetical protein